LGTQPVRDEVSRPPLISQGSSSRRTRRSLHPVGITLSTLSTLETLNVPLVEQDSSGSASFGILSTYPPTPCGLATFSAALSKGLCANGSDVSVVRVADGSLSSDARVIGELVNGSAASVAATSELLNESDIAVVQHEYGIYGGVDGDEVVDIIGGLHIPSIVVAHTVLKDPTPHQRSVLETIAAMAAQVVVMSEAARQRLCLGFDVDRRKVTTIAHGATVLRNTPVKRSGRPTLLTWGLLGPGKGIERVIEAMGSLHELHGRPRYLIAGRQRFWPPMARHTATPAPNRRGCAASRTRCASTPTTATCRR
jgi:hypothetical protein